ncbi:hypothetical protein COLU111180_04260 [Cohnella lubricantis]|uniref:Uncharacterized protein n=1 Tax=Cohnella lubricantis TaxID=2163172 RepID=A0A841TB54_9BACL|nr:hypothetical protein [Cohnella lubricantis]MBB6676480.1 hypothetical protein [Cohnella lubricantis]MBP2117097.1 hypothetical protein [Cohnella lubricantis]
MNWRLASTSQLYEIAYHDDGAHIEHRIAAAAEIKRRNRRKYGRTHFKIKEVYQR